MNRLPRISIVTISFEQHRFLMECIDSVHRQRRDSVEYVVVDPGSTDGSLDLLKAAATEGKIDKLVIEVDEGPADGLNKGFQSSTNEILGYINADDRLVDGAIDFVLNYFADHPMVDVLCGSIGMIDECGQRALRGRTADKFELRRYIAGVCLVPQQATFFRRNAFERAGGFNTLNRVSWDGELLVDLALSGATFATCKKVLGEFRIYSGTISSGGNAYLSNAEKEHLRLARKVKEHDIRLFNQRTSGSLRLVYKINVWRHIKYLAVGRYGFIP